MAHNAEPMDVDCMDSEFDNKENTFHHGNVPCTEKGYEELDVSELNMKLRFSMTPASSPMSKSYTACPDNRYPETEDTLNCSNVNTNLTRSLNSTMTKNDSVIKSLKSLPLQSLRTEQFPDGNGNASVLRPLDTTRTEDLNITVSITGTNDIDENLSSPSSTSSALHTPEATTPTKDIKDGGSPIMRGLKSVLNMFRSSQSPVPPADEDGIAIKQETSLMDALISENMKPHAIASTPIATHQAKEANSSKRSSPYKDSIVFNDDLEKELNWNNDTTINSSIDKIPIHKMLLQNNKSEDITARSDLSNSNAGHNLNATVEYMDVSNNDTVIEDKTITEYHDVRDVSVAPESDGEFVDCETTFSKNESYVLDVKSVQQRLAANDTFSKNESYILDVQAVREVLSPSLPMIDVPTNVHNDSTKTIIQSDITNFSFTDLDFKNDGDVTLPTDFSNYSKCTSEILSELEKVEANISSEVETKITENIDKNNVTEQVDTNNITTNVPDFENQSPESQDPQIREEESEKNKTITQIKDINTEVIPHAVDVLETEITKEVNNLYVESVQNEASMLDNSTSAKQNKEEILEKDVKITQTELNTDDPTPKMVDVPVTDITSEAENTPVKPELIEKADVPTASAEDNTKGECSPLVDASVQNENVDHQILNTTVLHDDTKAENVSEEIISQDCTNISLTILNNVIESVPLDSTNVMQNDFKTVDVSNVIQIYNASYEDINVSQNENVSSVDLSVTHNDATLNSSEIPPIPNIDTINISNVEIPIVVAQSPSDVPLPDDDDVEKENEPVKISAVTVENIPIIDPEMNMAANLIEPQLPELVSENVEKKVSSDSILTSEPKIAQSFEYGSKQSIESCEEKLESLPINIIDNVEVVLPKVCNMSLDKDHPSIAETPVLTSDVIGTGTIVTDVNKEKSDEALHSNKAGDNSKIPEKVTTSINKEMYSNVGDINTTIDCSQYLTDTTNVMVSNVTLEQVQSSAQDEPMDISFNETMNKTQVLPDLVNQTTVTTEGDSTDVPQQEVTANVSDVKSHEEINLDVSKSDHRAEIEVKLVVNTPSNDIANSQKLEENVNASLPVNQEIKLDESENIETHTLTGDCLKNYKIENDELPPQIFTNIPVSDSMDEKAITVDEEVIVSANNSPYVSLMSGIETVQEKTDEAFEEIENPFATGTSVASSPPIVSKGYNFNFDDIEDPFASKTKIRLSPPFDTPTKTTGPYQYEYEAKDKQFKVPSVSDSKRAGMNRRKSQPAERKKPAPLKKKFNASFDAKDVPTTSVNKLDDIVMEEDKNKTIDVVDKQEFQENHTNEVVEFSNDTKVVQESHSEIIEKELTMNENQREHIATNSPKSSPQAKNENKIMIDSVTTVANEIKTPSSSEQSAYYSASASSTESIQSKNVFNLPEIDDMNFNPFATKSKIRQSPPPIGTDIDNPEIDDMNFNPFATKSKMRQSPPPSIDMDNPFATKTKIRKSPEKSTYKTSQLELNRTATFDESKITQLVKSTDSEDKMETELMEKNTSANTTCTISSKASDSQNLTTREVNTEDEDTIEGPFLDVGDEIEKMPDVTDNDDMMQFHEIKEAATKIEGSDENLDGEIFIDAEAFEFLLNQNKTNIVADSGKESLFLKFDPLFAKRISSDGLLATLSAQKKQSTPTKSARPSLRNEASPIAGPSAINVTHGGETNISQESIEDANITVTKPMMVVPPAVNPAVTPRNKSITPTRSNRRSITFTSPAIAVIDRLLSMSSNNSLLGHDTTVTHSNSEQTEADQALTQLRELLAEKEISVYNLRSESDELKKRLAAMESQVINLEMEGQMRLKKINELNDRVAEKTKMNKRMAAVVEEYERTIASLIADIEQDKKRNAEERMQLIHERDQQTAHLTNMEASFSDLHSKYERSKQVILTSKANEDIYKKSIKDFEEQVTKMQANYEMLKQHATAKLNHANQELEKMNRAHEAEVVKLKAMIKRNQLLASSLQESLAQKTKANDELTAICDELINKVG